MVDREYLISMILSFSKLLCVLKISPTPKARFGLGLIHSQGRWWPTAMWGRTLTMAVLCTGLFKVALEQTILFPIKISIVRTFTLTIIECSNNANNAHSFHILILFR